MTQNTARGRLDYVNRGLSFPSMKHDGAET